MSTDHEVFRRLIFGHFGHGLRRPDEARLRAHLANCAECRQSYEDHQIAERLDPTGSLPRERLAKSLGLRSEKALPLRRARGWTFTCLSVAGAVALILAVRSAGRDDGVRVRGSHVEKAASAELAVFRIGSSGESSRVTTSIAANDELAFAYRNEVGKGFLMVFGVDRRNRVVWYHPAWTRADDNPLAVTITTQVGFKELPEAVRQPLQGPTLTVYGLFMDNPLDVRTMERRLAGSGWVPRPGSGELLRALTLEVRP